MKCSGEVWGCVFFIIISFRPAETQKLLMELEMKFLKIQLMQHRQVFFFYKSVLSETRQVISLMQTAEIFCLKTHERVNECHFIDLTED